MLVKSLTRTEPALRIIFYMALFMFIWAVPPAALHWTMPSPTGWLLLTGVAICSTAAHWALVKAYSLANVVQVMPFDFCRLIWTALFAWFFFGEQSALTTWVGAAIIVASVVFIARRDAKVAPIL
jgi:drug/metabolite transporter (DMT)-like permease